MRDLSATRRVCVVLIPYVRVPEHACIIPYLRNPSEDSLGARGGRWGPPPGWLAVMMKRTTYFRFIPMMHDVYLVSDGRMESDKNKEWVKNRVKPQRGRMKDNKRIFLSLSLSFSHGKKWKPCSNYTFMTLLTSYNTREYQVMGTVKSQTPGNQLEQRG